MTSPAVIKYEPFYRVHLFGGTPLVRRLASYLSAYFKVSVWISPRQMPEAFGDFARKSVTLPFSLNVCEDINEVFPLDQAESALGIGLGEAWPFGSDIREAFGDRLVDFMSIPYPSYLGGAHVSHAILRGEREWGCCMQLVTANTVQGEMHDGAVIYGTTFSFPPEREHDELEGRALDFVVDFVRKAGDGYAFKPGVTTYAEHQFPRMHFPRLNTQQQGWVDWSWRRLDVLRFIRAFDRPYPGARTLIHDGSDSHVVTVHDAIDFGVDDYHPFQAGIITAHDGPRATVALRGGALAVTIRDDLGRAPVWLRPGMRLHTDRATLDQAMIYSPQYSPVGDLAHATRD